jgi:hypothetical protein
MAKSWEFVIGRVAARLSVLIGALLPMVLDIQRLPRRVKIFHDKGHGDDSIVSNSVFVLVRISAYGRSEEESA